MALNMNHCKKLINVGDLQKAIKEYDETVKLWKDMQNSNKKLYADEKFLNMVDKKF